METVVYNQKGEQVGRVTLPESVFGARWNADLVHQVAQSMLSSRREGTAHTKTRGEVRGGGKKPWRQKGTGRARHGSIRSPIWVGGGVAHGPRNDKNYFRKVSKDMKRKAFYAALSRKQRDGEILFLNRIVMPEIKTKDAKEILGKLAKIQDFGSLTKKHNAAHIVLAGTDAHIEKSFRNLGNISVGEARNLNLLDVLSYKYLVIAAPEESIKQFIRTETPKHKARTPKQSTNSNI